MQHFKRTQMIIAKANRLQSVKEYYFSTKLQEIRELNTQGKDIINLGIGSPDLAPDDSVIKTLSEAALNQNNHAYQNYRAVPELREAISQYYTNTFGVSANAETEILPLIGSKEGIMHISMAFLNPGDTVLVPNPGYPTYTSVSNLLNTNIVTYNLLENNNWQPDLEQIEKEAKKGIKLLWINYPNMPTGADLEGTTISNLLHLAKTYKFLIVNDNPYSQILNPSPKSIFLKEGAKEVCLELNSLSKSHNMAGWRLGWIVGGQEYINTILQVKSNMDSGMFLPVQLAAAKALSLGSKWFTELNNEYAKRRKLAFEILDFLDCTYSQSQVGMFVWAKIPETTKDAGELSNDILYNKNVFLTPGFIFGSQGERYLRISLCTPEARLKEALERIKN